MDKFLETYNLPRLNHEEIGALNRWIMSKKIESVIKNLSTKKIPEPDGFPVEFHQKIKEELTPILFKLFQKIGQEEILPNSLYEVSFLLIPKPDKNTTRK